jgi:hypothetical protein
MRIVTREIIVKTLSEPVIITPLGDTHIGAVDCNEPLLKSCIERIRTGENHYWIGMGDYGEWIMPNDKRFTYEMLNRSERAEKMNDFMGSQLRQTVAPFIPIKDKCLGLLQGNHEETISNRYFKDVYLDICNELETNSCYDPYAKMRNANLSYTCIMRIIFKSKHHGSNTKEVLLWLHHGAGGGRKSGAKVNRIEEQAQFYPDCDIFLMGHVHTRVFSFVPAILVRPRTNKMMDRTKFFGITGTFKKTYQEDYSGYGERAQMPPTALGVISLKIIPEYGRGRITRIEGHSASDGMPL